MKHREADISIGLAGCERNISKGYSYGVSGSVGLFDRFEICASNDFLGQTTFDFKMQLFESPPQIMGGALTVGLTGCNGKHREPFVSGRYDMKGFRLHGGYWNTGGEGRAFIGTDFPVLEHGSGSLSLIAGHHGWGWVTLSWEFESLPGVSLELGVGFPAVRSDGIQHTLDLSYGFRF